MSGYLNIVFWVVPILIISIVAEYCYSQIKGHFSLYKLKDLWASCSIGVGSLLTSTLVKLLYSGVIFYLVFEIFNPINASGERVNVLGYVSFGWAWYLWIICQVLDEFSHYWHHRLNHTVRILWASHIVHHSSEHYNYGTGLRIGWVANFYKPFFYLWIPAIGFLPEMVITCMTIESIWQFFLHTSYCPKLGFLEKFLITPKQHQVHHATNINYLDKNHGAIFNFFDKLFGSWQELDDCENIQYGVTKPPNSYSPIVIITHEYLAIWSDVRQSETLIEIFMYVFGPPGWSPDNSTLTVRQLQSKINNNQSK
jgi:sterol desaturase/sphingolipid hydroxylase (fatty acid hydroxylase superfamily)